jgi:hypothetical protein
MSSIQRIHKADLGASFEAICLQSRPIRSAFHRNQTSSTQGTGQRVGVHPPSRRTHSSKFRKTAHLANFGRRPKIEPADRWPLNARDQPRSRELGLPPGPSRMSSAIPLLKPEASRERRASAVGSTLRQADRRSFDGVQRTLFSLWLTGEICG